MLQTRCKSCVTIHQPATEQERLTNCHLKSLWDNSDPRRVFDFAARVGFFSPLQNHAVAALACNGFCADRETRYRPRPPKAIPPRAAIIGPRAVYPPATYPRPA